MTQPPIAAPSPEHAAQDPSDTARDDPAGKIVSAQAYLSLYDPLQGFERVCSLARQRQALRLLSDRPPGPAPHVLEIGCGAMILARMAAEAGLPAASWTVVEPLAEFADAARQAMQGHAGFAVVQSYLETAGPALRALRPDGFDVVIIAGVLHETARPQSLLQAACDHTARGGLVHASVPNARSFHRLLAVQAGLIPAPDALSDRDRALGHPVVYDRQSLTALMQGAGLTDLTFDGYLFKPLTNAQMEPVLAASPDPDRLIDGLIALGRDFPDQAAEICVTGRRP